MDTDSTHTSGLGGFGGFDGVSGFNGFNGFGRFCGFDGFSGFGGFDGFLSFIYSPFKGFISSSKLPSELYLAEGEPQISRKERFIDRYLLQYGVLGDCVF